MVSWLISGHEITSSLSLQMSLYFNAIFFPFWILTTVTMLYIKVSLLSAVLVGSEIVPALIFHLVNACMLLAVLMVFLPLDFLSVWMLINNLQIYTNFDNGLLDNY